MKVSTIIGTIIALCICLFGCFCLGKVADLIDWSWVYVCIPLYVVGAIVAFLAALVLTLTELVAITAVYDDEGK